MSSVPRSAMVRQFRMLFEAGSVAGLTDGQLLERFLDRPDEAGELAFEALVSRHGPMVLGVCQRALADPNDVADAFQATFLILVRKARSIRVGDSLGRWLYGVSRKVASRARLEASKRPREIPTHLEARPTDPDRFELARLLDEELARLPEAFRSALVLCDLGGLTHEEAARDLVCPVGTIKSRLARGRRKLRANLERRGFAPALMLLSSPTLPPRLAEAAALTSRMALNAGSATAGIVPASAVALAQGVLKTMPGYPAKLVATALLSLGLVATGAGVVAQGQKVEGEPAVVSAQLVPGSVEDRPGRHVVEIVGDRITLNGKTLTIEEDLTKSILSLALGESKPETPIPVDFKVDEATRYSELFRIIKKFEAAGINKFAFEEHDASEEVKAPGKGAARPLESFQDQTKTELEVALNQPVTLNFKDAPLADALESISNYTHLKFVIDEKSLEQLKLTPRSPINLTTIQLKVRSALKHMLRPLGLVYQIDGDIIRVIAPNEAQTIEQLRHKLDQTKAKLQKARRISRRSGDPAIH